MYHHQHLNREVWKLNPIGLATPPKTSKIPNRLAKPSSRRVVSSKEPPFRTIEWRAGGNLPQGLKTQGTSKHPMHQGLGGLMK